MKRAFLLPLRLRKRTSCHLSSDVNPHVLFASHLQTILANYSSPSSEHVSDIHVQMGYIDYSAIHFSSLLNPFFALSLHPVSELSWQINLEPDRFLNSHIGVTHSLASVIHPSLEILPDHSQILTLHPSTIISLSSVVLTCHWQTIIEQWIIIGRHVTSVLEQIDFTDTGCNPLILEVFHSDESFSVVECSSESLHVEIPVDIAIDGDSTWSGYVTEFRIRQAHDTLYDECEVGMVLPVEKADLLSRMAGLSLSHTLTIKVGGTVFTFALEEVSRLRVDSLHAEIQLWGRSSQAFVLERDWPSMTWVTQFVDLDSLVSQVTGFHVQFDRPDIGGGSNNAIEMSFLFEARKGVKVSEKLIDLLRESHLRLRAPAEKPGWLNLSWEFVIHPLLTASLPPRAVFLPRWIREQVNIQTFDMECDAVRVVSAEAVPAKLEICPSTALCVDSSTPFYALVYHGGLEDYVLSSNIPGLSFNFESSETITRTEFFTAPQKFSSFHTQYPFLNIESYTALSGSIVEFTPQPSTGEILVEFDSETGGIVQVEYKTVVDWYRIYIPTDFPPTAVEECEANIMLELAGISSYYELKFNLFDSWCDEIRLNARFTDDFVRNVALCHLYATAFVRETYEFQTPYCDCPEIGSVVGVFSPLDGRIHVGYLRRREISFRGGKVREIWQDLEVESFLFSR